MYVILKDKAMIISPTRAAQFGGTSVVSAQADDGISRKFKRKNIPANLLRHFPITPRLQELLM